jgi:type I restriction enzyme, S subunit
MSELPKGWCDIRLLEVSDVIDPNPKHRNPKYVSEGFPFVSTAEFTEPNGVTLDTRRRVAESTVLEQEARCAFSSNSVFFSRKGTIGKTRLHPGGRLALLDSLCVINPSPVLAAVFLVQALRSPQVVSRIGEVVRGVALRQVSVGEVRELVIPIPPLNEQHRIVDKLEALQARSRRAREALDAVPPLLEKLRQSILAAAFRGDLTKDWRAANPNVEPATELLKRIRKERRAAWERTELAKLTAKGKPPTDDKWKAKYKEPDPIDTTGLPELPAGWCWASMDEVLTSLRNGISTKPSETEGLRILRISAVRPLSVNTSDVRYLLDTPEHRNFQLSEGDLLLTRYNGNADLVGVAGTVRVLAAPTVYPDKLIRARPVEAVASAEFLEIALNTGATRTHVAERGKSAAGQIGISGDDIRSAPVPIPPIREQLQIARVVQALFAFRGAAISTVAGAVTRITELERTLLAKAFRGELVPQDPNDEPADVMLARIHADATTPKTPTKGRRAPLKT